MVSSWGMRGGGRFTSAEAGLRSPGHSDRWGRDTWAAFDGFTNRGEQV